MKPTYGSKIERKDADRILDKRTEITNRLKSQLLSTLRASGSEDDLNFFDNEYNGFIFSKTELDRLFKEKSEWGDLDVLLVAMAAEIDKKDYKMRPTVFIAACSSKEIGDEIKLKTPDVQFPASETPPKKVLLDVPLRNGNGLDFSAPID